MIIWHDKQAIYIYRHLTIVWRLKINELAIKISIEYEFPRGMESQVMGNISSHVCLRWHLLCLQTRHKVPCTRKQYYDEVRRKIQGKNDWNKLLSLFSKDNLEFFQFSCVWGEWATKVTGSTSKLSCEFWTVWIFENAEWLNKNIVYLSPILSNATTAPVTPIKKLLAFSVCERKSIL